MTRCHRTGCAVLGGVYSHPVHERDAGAGLGEVRVVRVVVRVRVRVRPQRAAPPARGRHVVRVRLRRLGGGCTAAHHLKIN